MESFETKLGKYYLGDALELIKNLPSNSIDIILTDPPFGLFKDEFDNEEVFFKIEDELYRVLKDDAWLVFYYSIKKLMNVFRLKRFKYSWMIIAEFSSTQMKGVLGDRKYLPILIFRKGKPKVLFRRYDVIPAGELPFVYEFPKDELFKPTYTTSILLQMFTREGDLVLDPFAGYGSIPIVCEYFNRRWIAFEIDKVKYEIAKKIITSRKVGNIRKMRMELRDKVMKRLDEFIT